MMPEPVRNSPTEIIPTTLGKAHELRIPRPPIRANIILREASLGIYPSCLIEIHSSAPHDPLDLPLGGIVEASAGVSGADVAREVEGRGAEARFNI